MSKPPKGTRKNFPQRLSEAEKREVVRLSKKLKPRITQRQIAIRFGCGVDTIRAVQQGAGVKLFREVTPVLEQQIVAYLREGNGQHATAKKFRVSDRKIHSLMAKHHIHHPTGDAGLPLAKRATIIKKILKRESFGNRIAEKENVSRTTVLDIAHELLGPGRFCNKHYPLTFLRNGDADVEANAEKFAANIVRKKLEPSEKNFDEKMNSIYAALVERYVTLWHGGKVPEGKARVEFIARLLEETAPDSDRLQTNVFSVSEWLTFRDETAEYLATACDCVARTQTSRWTN